MPQPEVKIRSQASATEEPLTIGFDWDGTLFDDDDMQKYREEAHQLAIQALRDKGIEPDTSKGEGRIKVPVTDDAGNIILSKTRDETSSEYFSRLYPNERNFEEATRIKNEHLLKNSKIYKKALQVIESLLAKGHNVFISTNYRSSKIMFPIIRKHILDPIKEKHNIDIPVYFDAKKPDPKTLHQAAEYFEVNEITPQNFAYIGNSEKDVAAAFNAGSSAVFIGKSGNVNIAGELMNLIEKNKLSLNEKELSKALKNIQEYKSIAEIHNNIDEIITKIRDNGQAASIT